jgi:Uma2 family endonuclease
MSAVAERLLTEEEYLKLEDESTEERHEYIEGVLRLMAGTTQEHNDIVQNFVFKLMMLAREKSCRLAVENIRVKLPVGSKKKYYYPDVVLTCKPDDGDRRTIENPCFVVEILSKSTSSIDKGEKLDTYQRIASIKQYVIVDQARRKVEVYTRHGEAWIYKMLEAGSFNVACLETTMTIDDVYAGLTFESTESETNQ